MREIKFRYWWELQGHTLTKIFTVDQIEHGAVIDFICMDDFPSYPLTSGKEQFIGLQDKNGVDIYESDVMQFSNKLEWYRSPLLSKNDIYEIINNHIKYPYERRVVKIPEDYEWLLSSEIQSHWEVIGNIYENPELKENK